MQINNSIMLGVLRGSVVISSAVAGAFTPMVMLLPVFVLQMPSINSFLQQYLYTTHVYTPIGDNRVDVTEFYTCHTLVKAFKISQVALIIAFVCSLLAFFCSVVQASSTFVTNGRFRLHKVSRLPLIIFLVCAFIVQSIAMGVFQSMYEENWCTTPPSATSSASSLLSLHSTSLTKTMHGISGHHDHNDDCNPLDGCVYSFKEMGYKKTGGFNALIVTQVFTLLCCIQEIFVLFFSGKEGEPVVAVLPQETEPLIH